MLPIFNSSEILNGFFLVMLDRSLDAKGEVVS